MARELILIEFPWGRDKDPRVPLGHASLIATLNMIGNCIVYSFVRPINNIDIDKTFLEIIEILSNTENKVDIAFGVYVWCEEQIQTLSNRLRKHGFQGRIILGGPQISYSGRSLEKHYPQADIFVRGYGEFAIAELMNSDKKIKITGVHYAGDVDYNEQTNVDLDLLPSPWINEIINLENQHFTQEIKNCFS